MRAGQTLLHYKSGRWTTRPVPAWKGLRTEIYELDRIPKTTSLWGGGALEDTWQVDRSSVILKYGR